MSPSDCDKYKITANMFMLVYMEVMTNIPLMHHASIVQTVKTIGGDLGFHHYERRTANRMVQHMSSIMHGKLLHHIKNSDTLLSIIVDGRDAPFWQNPPKFTV